MTPTIEIKLTDDQLQFLIDTVKERLISEMGEQIKNACVQNYYMNKEQACKYCGVSYGTFNQWMQQGLTCVRLNRQVKFDPKDIHKFMDQHKDFHLAA